MWPNKPKNYVRLANDENAIHFGLYLDMSLISIVSLFSKDNELQFRKFATLQSYQGKGYGSKLLSYCFAYAKNEGYRKIWCNARTDKSAFYKKFGLKETDTTFEKGGLQYVIMEKPL
ncbi:GNAT family N-acetyltransferase [Seonamhaeicola marinus]|uniref:GNAT family N-acetyltransferase n=2 Tax=Seonamhaeicola marinus TaxID=1912246 RepID=A0A5D0HUI6_9FLAO|nr:GNAT family N-acetyltransferase [Seonamhaeicola marinus]